VLSDFEQRLADVLGARLPAPLQGSVDVAPGRDEARVVVSVLRTEPFEEHLFERRLEVVPGAPTQRRVVRLRCDVDFAIRRLAGQTRADQVRVLDQVIYALDHPEFRTGDALRPTDGSDPGFLIQRLTIPQADPPASITLRADGLFWPPDVPGQTGVAISEVRLRVAVAPLRLNPARPRLVAGEGPVDLALELDATGTLRLEGGGRITPVSFGAVVVAVVDSGGRPGAGTLAGGTAAGAAGARTLPVTGGQAVVQYTPPAQAAVEQLVVALDDGAGGVGIELGRFPLDVRGA
jgi:hypothetical protein